MRRRLCSLFLVLSLLSRPAYAHQASETVTRGQFLLLLWRAGGEVPFDKTAHPFTDLEEDAFSQAAAWAFNEGLICGVGSDLFAPYRSLTREECAVLLRRWDSYLGRNVFYPEGAAACNDFFDISPWADDSLYWACGTGRMDWRYNRLAPLSPVTWAEALSYFNLELF